MVTESKLRHLVDVSRQAGHPDHVIKRGLEGFFDMKQTTDSQKVVLRRVINSIDGNAVIKFPKGARL